MKPVRQCYRVGEKANFTVNVRKSGTLLNQVKVDYEAGPAKITEVKKSTTNKGGTKKKCGSLNRPGFYRLKVIAPVHDAMCDYEAEIPGVAGGWPHYFYKED